MGSGKRPVDTCICDERGISRCSARLTDAICHGGEFSSQVSRSGVGCCSAAVVVLDVGSCSAALERSGVFAGQRRAAAAQLSSAAQGVGSGSVVLAAAAWLQRSSAEQGVGSGSVALAAASCQMQRSGGALCCLRRAAQRSSAAQCVGSGSALAAAQRRAGRCSAAEAASVVSCSVVE